VPVEVFVDEIFCRLGADGAEPLWAEGRHPDEVAGGGGVPVFAQTVDAAAFEHQQAVLHVVDLDLRERGTGGVGHGVDGEVEGEGVGQQRADEQVGVAVERDGGDLELAAGEEPWVGFGGDVGVEVGLVERVEREGLSMTATRDLVTAVSVCG